MGISVTRDEADKRREDPLHVEGDPNRVYRWVRTGGYNAESHMARMKDAGYEPVRRGRVTVEPGAKSQLAKETTQDDSTIKRGDTMLMSCPRERYEARRRAQQEITQRRTQGVMQNFRRHGGYDVKE